MISHLQSFPQFSLLPKELRLLVWYHCLPQRIVEEDVPYTLLDGRHACQACWPERTTFLNAQIPSIASVCAEARQTAIEWGLCHEIRISYTSIPKLWVQPRLDLALHSNWTRRRFNDYWLVNDCFAPDENDSVDQMIIRARWEFSVPLSISLVGNLFFPFDLEALLLPSGYVPEQHITIYDEQMPAVPQVYLDDRPDYLLPAIEIVEDETLHLTVIAISLHINEACSSDLFGLLGDAPIQTINFDDTVRLQRYYKLYKSNPCSLDEPYVDTLYQLILGPKFRAAVLDWTVKVIWILQAVAWKSAYLRKHSNSQFTTVDPALLWNPPLPQQLSCLRMDQHLPVNEHPWWEQFRKGIPQIQPQIMIRLCDNQCYMEENRPATFGTAWFQTHNRKPGRGGHLPHGEDISAWRLEQMWT